MSVRRRRRCRITSWAAANGIRCVNPSIATASPSRMVSSTAAERDRNCAIAKIPRLVVTVIYGPGPAGSNAASPPEGAAAAMLTNRRTIRIAWGDCDPAGIVFYPRYFAMFDHSTVLLVERALGMAKHKLYGAYDFDGSRWWRLRRVSCSPRPTATAW